MNTELAPEIKRTPANSLLLREMPEGCKLCIRGAKLVLFVTGICNHSCYYCPLSEKRRGKDVVYANERPVKSYADILEEARLMDALGTGITGGNPALKFKRVIRYLKLLKREFGKEHHVHMYCIGALPNEKLKELKDAGLDELRFHTWTGEPVRSALKIGLDAGVEIPAIPRDFSKTIRLLKELDEIGCLFVNLNELEFSETNSTNLLKRGFKIKSDESVAVRGSEPLAMKVLNWAAENTDLNVHYCPSSLKDGVQLRNRLKRRAKNVAKPYERITREGLLVKGIVYGIPRLELIKEKRRLIRKYRIPNHLISVDLKRKRLDLDPITAETLSKKEKGLKFAWIEYYPTFDQLEVTFIPLPLQTPSRKSCGSNYL